MALGSADNSGGAAGVSVASSVENLAENAAGSNVARPAPSLLYGLILSGPKRGSAIEWSALQGHIFGDPNSTLDLDRETIWLHIDYTHPDAKQWLNRQHRITPLVVEALLREEARPRVSALGNSLLASLRSINFSAEAKPEDMVALRLWTDARLIITSRRRHVLAAQEMAERIQSGDGPETAAGFLVALCETLILHMQETISDIEDYLGDIEEQVLLSPGLQLRTEVAKLRRQAIALRRYLAPQRDAMLQLQNDKISWLGNDDRSRLRETTDHLHRYIEDLDSVRDRAAVTQEELANRLAEQLNNRMYVLSLVAAIFLPLGFFTGLLGINVGGIPLAHSSVGFVVVLGLLVVIVSLQLWLLKIKKWF